MAAPSSDDFFIGWLGRIPAAAVGLLTFAAAALVAGFAALALGLGSSVDDPGDGRFEWDAGPQTMTGIIRALPYPVLRLPPSAAHPMGHAVMLAGWGKVGAQGTATPLDGKPATAKGTMLKRGDLDMMQIDSLAAAAPVAGHDDVPAASAPDARAGASLTAVSPPAVSLGRWRLVGEICDGKCYAGAMRPGTGLAHKACANLCLFGGLPPVLVTATPVEGQEFLLLAGPDGGPLPEAAYRDLTALRISLDGDLERVDDLLVFRTNLAEARVE